MRIIASAILVLGLGVVSALADSRQVVLSREAFTEIVTGRTLSALGVSLSVQPDGEITGRAFGRDVTGNWDWQGGYFCRELNFGDEALPANCQQVVVDGTRITFIADRGAGQRANLRLR